MTTKQTRFLENIKCELLEELGQVAPSSNVCLFYKMVDAAKCFIDYEMAENDYNRYLETVKGKDRELFIETVKSGLESGKTYKYYNISYDDELIELVTLKEALFIICDLLNKEVRDPAIIVLVNLWIQNITPYRLADLLNLTKQTVNFWFTGKRPVPKMYYETIAHILKFDVKEFERKKSSFNFVD